MREQTFGEAMAYLAAAYRREITQEQAAVYWDQLQDLEDDPFMTAVKMTVQTEDRLPSVATLRYAYREERRRARQAQPPPSLPPPMDPEVARYYIERMRAMLR
ncbi:hypothetical protein [Halorhodospira neutriphila]|uniref:Replicative helicase inhibitor G39P N-terminal domain-containing protein n=1 Tax=Halorhodospira neutriphila TaxID=168379 RepID=A0ABS1E7F9_9GAMM|nr:hypothetical protein [Halorhodospira neutriphila]MBK1727650.1 hypothetical protein [Halorhodospira neutriphila]